MQTESQSWTIKLKSKIVELGTKLGLLQQCKFLFNNYSDPEVKKGLYWSLHSPIYLKDTTPLSSGQLSLRPKMC